MARAFIIEDNENHMNSLEVKLDILGHSIVGKSFNSTGVIATIREAKPDLVLIDINLEGDNEGILLAEKIKQLFNISIIFTTALAENDIVKQAIKTNPEGYLLKPIGINELRVNIELALSKKEKSHAIMKNQGSTNLFLTVRIGHKLQKVNYTQIIYLERESVNYIKINTLDGKSNLIRASLRSILHNILPSNFIQIHKQYIINFDCIHLINEQEQMIQLSGKHWLPIGRTFKKELYKKLNLV